MRCQGRKGEGKGSLRIVKSAFFSARPLFEGIRNVYVHIETIRRARSQEATRGPVVVRAVAAGAWLPALQTRTGSVVSALLL